MAQDVVGGRHVEEHVGYRKALQEFDSALELERALTAGHLDRALVGSLERTRRHALQHVDGARDARAQLLERALVVLEAHRLLCGQPRDRVLGDVAGDLHLPRERQHVRREARGTAGSILRCAALLTAFSRIQERLLSVWLKSSTERACTEIFIGLSLASSVGAEILVPEGLARLPLW